MPLQWRACCPEGKGAWYAERGLAISEAELLIEQHGWDPHDVYVQQQRASRPVMAPRATFVARARARRARAAAPSARPLECVPSAIQGTRDAHDAG